MRKWPGNMGYNQAYGWQSVPVGTRFLTAQCDNRWNRYIRQSMKQVARSVVFLHRCPFRVIRYRALWLESLSELWK